MVLLMATAALWVIPHRGIYFGCSFAAHATATVAWLWLVWQVVRGRYRPGFAEAFGIALVLRVIVLPLSPALSDDIWRYLFEGRLVLEGINPYLTAPDSIEVLSLRGPYWELINNKSIPAAYPPAVQFVLAAAVWLTAEPFGMKLLFGALDLGVFVLLWRWLPLLGLDSARAIVQGWCPLAILEFAGEGHSDSLAVCFTVGALYASTAGRSLLAGIALGVATAGKLMPVVILPFLMRRPVGHESWRGAGWLTAAACGTTLVVLYAPFWVAEDPLSIFSGTTEYAARWRNNDTLFALIHAMTEWLHGLGWLGDYEVQRLAKVPLVGLGAGLLFAMWWWRWSAANAVLGFFLFFLVAAPTLHPWYVAFALPFFALRPNPGWLVFCGTVFLAYHVLPAWLIEQRWQESGWYKLVEFCPLYLGLLAAGIAQRRR